MARSGTLLTGEQDVLDLLLRSYPDERDRLQPYVRRAKAYHNECGCAMSGGFLVAALLLALIHGVWWHSYSLVRVPAQVALYAAFVLSAGIVGKMTGIAVARIRLTLLYRDVRHHFPRDGA